MASQFDPLGTIADAVRRAIAFDARVEHARNEQLAQTYSMRGAGISNEDSYNLARMLAYHPYTPQNQANYLALLKRLGYLRQQAF